jgi:hypothetical protein
MSRSSDIPSTSSSSSSNPNPSYPDGNPAISFELLSQMFSQLLREQREAVNAAVEEALQRQGAATSAASAASRSSSSSNIAHPPDPFPSLPKGVKLSPPPNYNGTTAVNAETWLFQMEQYLKAAGVDDDQQRIAVAVSYLRELASQWWINRAEIRRDAPQLWTTFKAAVRERFQPVSASRTARAALRSLQQGNESVAEYQAQFYKLIQLINDMNEADQIEHFLLGLRSSIAAEVDRCNPQTLQQAMIEAQKTETRFKNFKQLSSSRSYSSGSSYYGRGSYADTPSITTSTTTTANAPMELGNLNTHNNIDAEAQQDELIEEEYQRFNELGDEYEPSEQWVAEVESHRTEEVSSSSDTQLHAIQHRGQRRPTQHHAPTMTKEEFARLMKAGLCLRCKKPGHIARNCPLPPRTSNGRNFR